MENFLGINIALDVFSAVITIMIGAYLMSRRNRTKENRYFFWFCVLNLIFILGDLSDWCCNGLDKPWYPAVLHIGQFVYYVSVAPLMVLFMRYVTEYLSAYVRKPKIYLRITDGIAVLHLIGALITPFTGLYYTITPENIYMRGDFVALSNILPVASYILVTIMAIRYRKALRPRVVVALLGFAFLPLFGQAIQNLFRGVATLNAAVTLATLFIFFNIQLDRDIQHEKDKQELTEANIRVMLSQIQPHFLYNTLSAIRSLCEADPAKAKACIGDFAVFLRANMDSITNERPISFEQELSHAKSYLNLEQQMYGDELHAEYDIRATGFFIPALSLQPILENAVQKGLRKKEGGGRVTIRSAETEESFRIVIEDDGVGFDLKVLEEGGHIGIKNVRRRLAALCGGTLEIDSRPGKGTTVTMTVPKGGKTDAVSRS